MDAIYEKYSQNIGSSRIDGQKTEKTGWFGSWFQGSQPKS